MAEKTYADKLRDKRWQVRKMQIMARDHNKCQAVNCQHHKDNSVILNVHHIFYFDKDPWDYPDELLITLCENCHNSEHHNRTYSQTALINALQILGYLDSDYLALACLLFTDLKYRKTHFKRIRSFQNIKNG